MKARGVRRVVTASAIIFFVGLFIGLIGLSSARAQSSQTSAPGAEISAKPLLLEKNEGELRTRRIHIDKSAVASSQFMVRSSEAQAPGPG